jgi:hypothetical protein
LFEKTFDPVFQLFAVKLVIDFVKSGGTKDFAFVEGASVDPLVYVAPGEEPLDALADSRCVCYYITLSTNTCYWTKGATP